MKRFIIILVILLILGIGVYIGYVLIPKEESVSDNTNQKVIETDNTNQTVSTNKSLLKELESQLKISEREQMYTAARKYITEYSAEGMVVNLEIIKLLEKWVLLRVIPITIETDVATMVMEKVNGVWEAREFGTSLPEWKEKVPELFE